MNPIANEHFDEFAEKYMLKGISYERRYLLRRLKRRAYRARKASVSADMPCGSLEPAMRFDPNVSQRKAKCALGKQG